MARDEEVVALGGVGGTSVRPRRRHPPAGSRRGSSSARLIACVPLVVVLALGSIRLVLVTYRELTSPLDVSRAARASGPARHSRGRRRRGPRLDARRDRRGHGCPTDRLERMRASERHSPACRVRVLVPGTLSSARPLRDPHDRPGGDPRASGRRGQLGVGGGRDGPGRCGRAAPVASDRRRVRRACGSWDWSSSRSSAPGEQPSGPSPRSLGRGRSGGPLTADRVTGGSLARLRRCGSVGPWAGLDGEVNHDEQDLRLRRMRRIGPVRTTLLSVVWGAARVRHRRPQACSPSRPRRGPARSPERVGADRRARFRRRRRGSRDGCEQRQDAPTDRLARPGRRSIDCRGAARHRCPAAAPAHRRRRSPFADARRSTAPTPDADPSRSPPATAQAATPSEPAPAAPRPHDDAGIAPGCHPDRRPEPGRTAHAPLRADAGGGRPSARRGRRRREPSEAAAEPTPRDRGRRAHRGRRRRVDHRDHARRDGKGADRRSCRDRVAARRSEPRSCLCSSPRRSLRCRRRPGRRSSSLPRRSSDARISAISHRKPFRSPSPRCRAPIDRPRLPWRWR